MPGTRTMKKATLFVLLATGTAWLVFHGRSGLSQGLSAMREKALAEPYRGVTTNGTVIPNLFPIRATGVSTKPIQLAAESFLAALTEEQRTKTTYAVDDIEWRKWDNVHRASRQGVRFGEMTEDQREKAYALFRASLSAKGLEKSRNIMKLNEHLAELVSDHEEYGEGLYYITIMGEPSANEPWGWQLDGHHLVINYFILGDQVVMTPTFMGSEPVVAHAGKYAGTRILKDEQDAGLALFRALDNKQQARARLSSHKLPSQNVSEGREDNLILQYVGIPARDLTVAQKQQLLALINLYASNMKEGHARVRMEEVREHIDETYFAWIGEDGPDAVFYYRIHSPVILIEFDHNSAVSLPGRTDVGNPEHIHTVVRTPNGNDYGKDLLRQHYATSPHHRH